MSCILARNATKPLQNYSCFLRQKFHRLQNKVSNDLGFPPKPVHRTRNIRCRAYLILGEIRGLHSLRTTLLGDFADGDSRCCLNTSQLSCYNSSSGAEVSPLKHPPIPLFDSSQASARDQFNAALPIHRSDDPHPFRRS